MELKTYVHIVWRRVWIPVVLTLFVLVLSVLSQNVSAASYSATMRFVVGLRPEPRSGDYYTYDRYYTWLTAEYLIDDLAEVVRSASFAGRVHEQLTSTAEWASGSTGLTGAILGSTSSGKLHRILTVTITWNDPDQLADIANAVSRTLAEHASDFFPLSGQDRIEAQLIDPPAIGEVRASFTERLQLPIRLALALIAGIVLTFVLYYFDDTIQGRDDLVEIGLPVLTQVPRRSMFPWARRKL